MLHFILGRAGVGKSVELFELAKKAASAKKIIYIFVPEQFTFETERKYFDALGGKIFSYIKVLSFTRLAHNLFKEFGGVAGDYASDSVKLILMNMALFEIRDKLTVYDRAMKNANFSKAMVDMVSELKNSDCAFDEFEQKIALLPKGRLKQKSQDISIIYDAYEALLSSSYKDALDDLTRAGELISQHKYFANTTVFIDEFKGFTEKERILLEKIFLQADDTYLTLCTNGVLGGENSLFYSVNKTYTDLIKTAQSQNVTIAAPKILTENHRFKTPELLHLEQEVFSSTISRFNGKSENVTAVLAANEYDEVDFAMATSRALIESGEYRCKDIVFITRDLGSYRSYLETAFEKYELPYYMDTLKSASNSPLVRFVELALDCAAHSMSTDKILSMLKCGLTPFDFSQISTLENYAFLWSLKASDWRHDFTYSIYGVNSARTPAEKEEQREILESINEIRSKTVASLQQLRTGLKSGIARQMSTAILTFLEEIGARQALESKIAALDESDGAQFALADEYRRVWQIVGEIANLLAFTLGNTKLEPSRFSELFSLLCANFDMGTIPQTLDSITVGSAERIRTDCPRVVFVLGTNDKKFPYIPEQGGVYTDDERRTLIELLHLELAKPIKEQIKEERFIAYKALTMPSEKLYLTARKADIKGTTIAPSYLFAQLKRMFGEDILIDSYDLSQLYFCKSKKSAFSVLANQFSQDNELTASLKEVFSQDENYSSRMIAIADNLLGKSRHLTKKEITAELFGRTATLSPTKVEQYHKCKFRYFCEQAMGLRPREKIELNAVNKGSIVHEILYNVCSQITDFSEFDESKIKNLISKTVDEYILKMGGYEHQTNRFLYLYDRIKSSVFTLIFRMFQELSRSKFKPTDFEYQIGATGNVAEYKFVSEDDICIYIKGTIDRVDSFTNEIGEKYIRIIDYKTGLKEFKLSDVINGLNLQMFLYLMCLQNAQSGNYAHTQGAGALYMPASDIIGDLERDADDEQTKKLIASHYQMKGVVLDNEDVLKAMEPELDGEYTQINLVKKAYDNKSNKLKADVFPEHHANTEFFDAKSTEIILTREQLGKLYTVVETSISDMVSELYSGNIEAKPLVGKTVDGCAFCSFKNCCGFTEKSPVKEYLELSKKEIFDYIDGKEE